MKFEIQPDSSLICKSDELTHDDVELLSRTQFIEDVPVTIHCHKMHQQALIPFFTFISNVKCLYITVYFEKMDYETAQAIYFVAIKNLHTLKMKLDLGEKILAFISASVLNNQETQDIQDHLISGVYKKLQKLVLDYRYMSYTQANTLCRALLRAPLQSLEITCHTLDDETNDYLKAQLTEWLAIPNVYLSVRGQDQLRPAEEIVPPSSSEPNCLQKALTWAWSKLPCAHGEEADLDEQNQHSRHRKLR